MKKPDLNLDALRIEGSLLPAEFVQKLLELKADYQSATDYGIPPGLNLKDEIGRYWRIASAQWAEFKMRRDKPGANLEQVALNNWLVPLFTRVLGFEGWTQTTGEEIDERRFPLTYKLGGAPLLLLSHTYDLDKSDARFAPEGRRRSPHATMQEYLNASDGSLWGIVANGYTLRILRDNPSLTRPAYIEADLARIFEEERYADFVALWLLIHGTRFGNGTDGHNVHLPILEHWQGKAKEIGERALDKLRDGVTEALRQLGNGFIAHPANTALREALNTNALSTDVYFKQLLRLIYRLILLYTAEDRGLLHYPAATPAQRELYTKGYSADRLRERALKSLTDRHADLWQGLLVSLRGLANGAEPLGLPALGGMFATDRCPDLDSAELPNTALLAAVRAMCFFRAGAVLARINYRDMDTEELGSVYESLLELQPVINVNANPWGFGFVGDELEGDTRGSARKLTGSYYTPDELVQELIKSALEPKIAEALKAADPRAALLALKVIDVACGSGHFLLAAARRIAAEVARLDADSDIPEAQAYRHALREVVAHCIYGVDLNPLAVELCQTALWLETLEPGKPLGFLDHHVRHGNSLVGILDPAVMKEGIPDKAYNALSGDDKVTCTSLKRLNRAQGGGRQRDLFNSEAAKEMAANLAVLDTMAEDTVAEIATKRAAFAAAENNQLLARERLTANLFCAAFFAPKTTANAEKIPLSGDLLRAAEGQPMRPGVAELAQELAAEFHFFHWRLAFPEVFAAGGFNVVLGNPPWEVSQLAEEEFFAVRSAEIANLAGIARKRAIAALEKTDTGLWKQYIQEKHGYDVINCFSREAGRYPLTATGKLNLYALFSETIVQLLHPLGLSGFIVPSGLATDNTTRHFFASLIFNQSLVSFFELENEGFFPGAGQGHMLRFALTTISGRQRATSKASYLFQGKNVRQIVDMERRFTLTPEELRLINPNSKTCPIFQCSKDAELTKSIYRRVPVLIDESKGSAGNPWAISTRQGLFNMTSDSDLFRTAAQLTTEGAERGAANWVGRDSQIWVPLYESKMLYLYNHRHGDFSAAPAGERPHVLPEVSLKNLQQPSFNISPYYWVEENEVSARLDKRWSSNWLIGWRDITDARASIRTTVFSVFPKAGVGNTFRLIFPSNVSGRIIAGLIANFSSIILDYVSRQKVAGLHLTDGYLMQLPILPPDRYSSIDLDVIVPRVLELTYTAHDLAPFARDLGYDGAPFEWNPARRALLRAELDAYYAKLYGLTRDELRYILDPASIYGEDYPSETFRVLKNNEMRQFGEYRTQRLVLEAWDRLANLS